MNRSKALLWLPILFLSTFFASSCSGPKGGVCTLNCGGGGGNGNVVVTVTASPSQTFLFPYLEWAISEVDLLDSTGAASIVLQGALPPVEFGRLQTDSQLLGHTLSSIPAKTYSSVRITLKPSTASSFVYNSTGGTLFTGCATAGAICKIPNTGVTGFAATTVTVPASFSVTANSNVGFSLNFNLNKAVTTAGGMTFDFTQSGAITLVALPRAGQMAASLDSLQNFTGAISAKGTTTIDMFALNSPTRTITVPTTAQFNDPFNICGSSVNFNCLAINQNVSVDAVVNSDGTLTAYEVEFLDPSPGAQETEGIITAVSSGQFQILVTNGTTVSGILPGNLATVTLNSTSTYSVDPKNLGTGTALIGFLDSSDLVMGQTVMLKGGSINFTTTNTLSGYSRTLLRYSSIGGTVQTPAGTIFNLTGLSPFFTSSTTNAVEVQTNANATTYDNITNGFSGLTNGISVSVRGLYLNPNKGEAEPLVAAQVRAQP